jgi:tetratricopeptide (TPR) repeat protein
VAEYDLLELVREARPHLVQADPQTETYMDRLEERHDELSALVERMLAEDPAAAADACGILWNFWWQRCHMREGRQFLDQAAASGEGDLSGVLKGLGTVAFRQGDLDAAARAFEQRYELVGSDGSEAELVDACADMARVALRRGNFAEVRRWADVGYAAAEELDDPGALRLPLHMRAAAARMQGRYDEARELYLRSIELNEQLGNEINIAENHNLFYVELHSGNREEARKHLIAAREWIFTHENAYLRPYVFLDYGVLALHEGEDESACRLVACADRIVRDTDSIPDPDDDVELENATVTLRERLESRFDAIWAAGRALDDDQARNSHTRRRDPRLRRSRREAACVGVSRSATARGSSFLVLRRLLDDLLHQLRG